MSSMGPDAGTTTPGPTAYSPVAKEAARLLGNRVRLARKERRWTVADLAERVGVSPVTMRKVERGDLTVALGTAFEAAALTGVTLFHDDPARRALEVDRVAAHLAVLPSRVRSRHVADDDF
jgi:transcriptional regulator with XRE-family HTH domain